ncbi:DMT family transporter [Nocardioides sp. zg-1228]|uniref:EamA family transporter n=1 Tax=Nocardioides sp. zg-1228 TaxID=2763008 RepID=UPI0016434FCF|nr:EamA family transporter [Nocardioides sp. zg-1228]MBC2933257.1 EamA family transporter [Nocardioides sp. zg-1228]QSF56576.1 EamA family transporter [Nocardioides sp. zg-1228]
MTRRPSSALLGPVGLVLVGILSVQLGAAIAKGLFDEISPTSMVWLRLVTSALVLGAITRPRLTGRTRRDWLVVLGFGASLATMNWAIYQSMSRIPLGIAVTIEFIGPLSLAILGSRRARDLVWVGLAGAGVALLGIERTGLDLLGVACALLAGAAWAAYILLSASTGRRWDGLDGLAVASVVAATGMALPALMSAGTSLWDGRLLLLGALVGLLSSVIPYSCELIALRSLRPAVFGILMSLEPAAAALAAIVVLQEHLSPLQWLAIACVVAASVGATRSGSAPGGTPGRRDGGGGEHWTAPGTLAT